MSDDILGNDELEETEGEDKALEESEDAPEGTLEEEDMKLSPDEDDELDAFGFHKEEDETF